VVLKQFWWITKIYLHKHILVTCLKTDTSSVCQFYDLPRQLICFLRTFFRVREADLLKSTVGLIGPTVTSSKTVPMVCQDCLDRIAYTSSSSDRHTVLHTLWAGCPLIFSFSPPHPHFTPPNVLACKYISQKIKRNAITQFTVTWAENGYGRVF
jgi:hypothetical protein